MAGSGILVTGASGQLGRLVVDGLLQRGVKGVIATTRTPEALVDLTARGVDVRAADFDDVENLEAAFHGAEVLLLISSSAFESQVQQHRNAVDAARRVGVRRILYTSGPNAAASPAITAPPHWATEEYIAASGLDYTILRNYPYAEVLFLSLPITIGTGRFLGAIGDGAVAYVTRQDCADAAVAALLSDDLSGQTLDITGPRAWSHGEVAQAVGKIVGKPIDYVELPPEELKAQLAGAGFSGFWPEALLSFDLAYRQGDSQTVSGAVERLTGREPQGLEAFLRANEARLRGYLG